MSDIVEDRSLIDSRAIQDVLGIKLLPALARISREYAIPFIVAYVFTILAYSYLFTTIIFTNHTLPNAWVYQYPSFKTLGEGRWFADIIIQLTGGSGVQSLQMMLGAAIQIINGFLFAAFLRLKGPLPITLVAAFLALHPAFLDYYSFTVDNVSFALGDAFALLGILALANLRPLPGGVLAVFCFVLTLATYQPKIALIAVLLLIWSLNFVIAGSAENNGRPQALARFFKVRLMPALVVFVGSLLVYYLTVRLTVSENIGDRAHINGASEIWTQILAAYPDVWRHFSPKADYLRGIFRFLPLASVILGAGCIFADAFRSGRSYLLIAVVLIAVFPIALQTSYLINDATWRNSGRILSPEAYSLIFFASMMWLHPRLHFLSTLLISGMIWQFAILGSQRVNEAAMKTIFDFAKINRIVQRIENVTPDLYAGEKPIVIFGNLPFGQVASFRSVRDRIYGAQILSESFADYRQTEIMNFFLGRQAVRKATLPEFEAVLANPQQHGVWPAPDSVYLDNGTIVVLLGQRSPQGEHTWTQ
ncbi:MAG: glucosyltransferase domain-containing protein [Proteobacteria bacterium]|nr:glucosyltransferase domain-containing protein [Pseudomonadota bacterium]